LESSSEGRKEALRAGELGRDLEGSSGGGLRRIDCKTRLDIVLNREQTRRMRRRRRRR